MSGSVSEDGTKVAVALCTESGRTFVSGCPGRLVLAITRTDGSDSHEYAGLAPNPQAMMCWSPDASKLALVMQDRSRSINTPSALQIVDLATGATQVIASGHDAFVNPPCWSPDDKEVVYTASNQSGHELVSIYNTDMKTSRDFSKGKGPTWSPDGNWIAFVDCPLSLLLSCKYYAVRPSGSEKRLLFKSEVTSALWWSPDSRFVAYVNMAGFF
jgi:Tol biopolymer transport system component